MYAERYKAAFAALGQPLTSSHGIPPERFETFEVDGWRLPAVLRDYYLVAGLERTLNTAHNRLLPLEKIFIEAGRLVFMEENQDVVYWGVRVTVPEEENPAVQQGVNLHPEPLEWHDEHSSCADFLEVMLYTQASFGGGLKFSSSASVSPDFQARLDQAWRFVGEIGGMSVYARDGCALSFSSWFDDEWRVFGGFNTKKDMTAVARELELRWEDL
jgi:hypothetical protein